DIIGASVVKPRIDISRVAQVLNPMNHVDSARLLSIAKNQPRFLIRRRIIKDKNSHVLGSPSHEGRKATANVLRAAEHRYEDRHRAGFAKHAGHPTVIELREVWGSFG